MERELINTILSRRSIRRYTEEPITEEETKTLLEAAMAAPSRIGCCVVWGSSKTREGE
jgi:nitroreductase